MLIEGYPPAAARLATEERAGEMEPAFESDEREPCFEMSLERPDRALLPADVMLFAISRAAYQVRVS